MPWLTGFRTHLLVSGRPNDTVSQYLGDVRAFFSWLDRDPAEAGAADLLDYRNRQLESGVGLKPASVARYTITVRACYAWAASVGLIGVNPMAPVKVPPVPEGAARDLSRDDLDLLWRSIDSTGDLRLMAMRDLAYFAGLRCKQIAGAKRRDLQLVGSRPSLIVPRKGGGEQRIRLHPQLVTTLTRLRATYTTRDGAVIEDRRVPGRHLGRKHVSQLLGDAMREAGLAETAHALRHSVATALALKGAGENVIADFLDHRNPKVTRRYIKGAREEVAARWVARVPVPGSRRPKVGRPRDNRPPRRAAQPAAVAVYRRQRRRP